MAPSSTLLTKLQIRNYKICVYRDTRPNPMPRLVNDSNAQYIVETSRWMVQERNTNELFQDLIWPTHDTGFSRVVQGCDPEDKEGEDDQKSAYRHPSSSLSLNHSQIRKLMIANVSFGIHRDLLADLSHISRDFLVFIEAVDRRYSKLKM
ncbi:hypothetical protein BDQ12DRAFT_668404 [Crucibulum laeve]|uniref:HAM1-like N-terminal domain-containing protein n=1 Tax=Crucibulum laeve TaxID=68775 RepID=A0A5C3LTR2_9AGAR|nr:hypothetical protein BDQ12DRAFT_668404 [Crucibulum laeve]